MPDEGWDNLPGRVRDWMILRFALNTERDPWGWTSVIGAAAHLEYLAPAALWVSDKKPTPFNEYQPKRTLGQAARLIRERGLLDPAVAESGWRSRQRGQKIERTRDQS